MNDPRSLYRRFTVGVEWTTLIAMLARTLSLCLYYNRSVGYIDPNVFATLLYIGMAAFALWCVFYACPARKMEKSMLIAHAPDEAATTPALRYTSLLCAVTFIGAMAAELLICGFNGTFPLLRYLSAIVAALYFALPRRSRPLPAGLGVVVYGICTIAGEYFDWTVALNSPIKLMQEAALLSAMLFILVELNHLNHTRRSVRYTVCAALSLFCGVTNGLSLIVAALMGGIVEPAYLIHALPPMAVGLYAAARLRAGHEIALPEPALETDEQPATDEQPESEQANEQDVPTPTSQEEETNG